MTATTTRQLIAYYRVSTARQGRSGLGLEAQKAAVAAYAAAEGLEIAEEHVEIESGRCTDRPVLAAAIAACHARRARLCAAKLDRISRDSAGIGIIIKRTPIAVADMPHADSFQLHIYAALAEQEAKAISARTRAALQAAKARGVRLGNPRLQPGSSETARTAREALSEQARQRAAAVTPYIAAAKKAGAVTLAEIAEALTARGVATPRGRGAWHPAQISRILSYSAAAPA
jgi:DNA invertase Pin-like site-specific DNA recombinase